MRSYLPGIIIYGSQYGTTKCYAKKLSEKTGIPMMSYKEITDLSGCKTIIHMGGLYAGGVLGLKHILKGLPQNINLIIVTVGLADVTDEQNIKSIRESIKKQVPKEIYQNISIFHLRGGIDYDKLNFAHRTMMALLYKKVKNIPEEKKSVEDKAMVETFGKKVDFINFDYLNPIIELLPRNFSDGGILQNDENENRNLTMHIIQY